MKSVELSSSAFYYTDIDSMFLQPLAFVVQGLLHLTNIKLFILKTNKQALPRFKKVMQK